MKLGFVIPVFTNFRGTVEALESLTTKYDWEPLIRPQWRRNFALSKAWNEGITSCFERNCDFVFVINDDILFSPYTVDHIVDWYLKYGKEKKSLLISAVNVASLCPDPLDIRKIFDTHPEYWDQEGNYAEHPDYSCFMVVPEIFEHMGKFDENFIPAYFEDNDSHYRINLSGHTAVCVNNAPYYHFQSQTEKDQHFHLQFESNRNYYGVKWGGQPGQETFIHPYNDSTLSYKEWR